VALAVGEPEGLQNLTIGAGDRGTACTGARPHQALGVKTPAATFTLAT